MCHNDQYHVYLKFYEKINENKVYDIFSTSKVDNPLKQPFIIQFQTSSPLYPTTIGTQQVAMIERMLPKRGR